MVKKIGIVVVAVFVCGWAAFSALARPDYTQTSCKIAGANYAFIGMTKTSDIGKSGAPEYNVEFQQGGIVLRFPPSYYTRDWDDIERVAFETSGKSTTSGMLKLYIHPASSGVVEQIGVVRRPCWNAVKKYVREHVESKGTVVHISETMAK